MEQDVARMWFVDPRAFIASATEAVGSAVPTANYVLAGKLSFDRDLGTARF